MFTRIYKLYKSPINSASMKKKYNLFLTKEMQQYKIDYANTLNYIVGLNWPLGDKKVLFKNTKLKAFLYQLLWVFFYIYLIIFLIY